MTNLDTLTSSPADSPHHHHKDSLAQEALEWTLATAFPPIDASDDALLQFADSPAAKDLLDVAPRPALISLEELIRAIANAPRLIIRKVGVPIATLFAIAMAVFLHLSILGVFVLAIVFGFFQPKGRGSTLTPGDEGGSGVGYVLLGDGGPEGPSNISPNINNLLPHTETPPAFVPTLPVHLTPPPVAAQDLSAEPDQEVIGLATGAPVTGTLKPHPRVTTPPTATLVVAPPSNNVPPAIANVGPVNRAPAAGTGGLGNGGDPEGSPLALVNPGTGAGHGKGHQIGDGINTGPSGANNPNPSVLDAPQVELPDGFLVDPPKTQAIFEVTVLVTGRAGEIKLTQSCGNKDIDTLCAATIRRYKFRPAYVAGKPVEKSMTITQDFGNLH